MIPLFPHLFFFLFYLRFLFSSLLLTFCCCCCSSVFIFGARTSGMFWSPSFDGSAMQRCGHACVKLSLSFCPFCVFLFSFSQGHNFCNVARVKANRSNSSLDALRSGVVSRICFGSYPMCVIECICARGVHWTAQCVPHGSQTQKMVTCKRRIAFFSVGLYFFFKLKILPSLERMTHPVSTSCDGEKHQIFLKGLCSLSKHKDPRWIDGKMKMPRAREQISSPWKEKRARESMVEWHHVWMTRHGSP